MMRYTVMVGSRELEVVLRETRDGFVTEIDGRQRKIEVARLDRSSQYSFRVEDRSWPVFVERLPAKRGSRYVLGLRGVQTEVSIVDERERAAAAFDALAGASGDGEEKVESVIPGIVTQLLVALGDRVAPGQPLLIVEAMKMENEIAGEVEGVVQSIHVEAGQTVNAGDLLVTLGPKVTPNEN